MLPFEQRLQPTRRIGLLMAGAHESTGNREVPP